MRLALMFALGLAAGAARAEPLEDARAFDRAFAASFYTFDACGDAKYGGLFRDALAARFAQCPFSEKARAEHRRRSALQAKRSRDLMKEMIEETGGVPMRLPGMDETCHQHQAGPDYVAARAKLERFSEGALKAEDIVSAPCDADAIAP